MKLSTKIPNPMSKHSSKVKRKHSPLKKSLPWFLPKWKKSPKPSLEKKLKMPSSPFPPTSTMLNVKLPKMLELFLVWMWCVFSMNLQLLLLLMVLIKNKAKKIFSSSILEVVLLMCLFSLLIMEFLKWCLLLVTLISEEKILINESLIISWNSSRKNIKLIFPKTKEPFKNWNEKWKKLNELYLLVNKLKSKLNPCSMVLISLKNLPVLNSKNLIKIYSKKLWTPWILP